MFHIYTTHQKHITKKGVSIDLTHPCRYKVFYKLRNLCLTKILFDCHHHLTSLHLFVFRSTWTNLTSHQATDQIVD